MHPDWDKRQITAFLDMFYRAFLHILKELVRERFHYEPDDWFVFLRIPGIGAAQHENDPKKHGPE
jgi:hypothetical protein